MKDAREVFWGAAAVAANVDEEDRASNLIAVPENARHRIYMECSASAAGLAEQLMMCLVRSGQVDLTQPLPQEEAEKILKRCNDLAEWQISYNMQRTTKLKHWFKEKAKDVYAAASLILQQ